MGKGSNTQEKLPKGPQKKALEETQKKAQKKGKENAEETPQKVSKNPSTPNIIKNAPPSVLNVKRFASPITSDLRRRMSSPDSHKLDELLKNAKTKSDHYSGKWTNPKRLKRNPDMSDDQWQQEIESRYDTWFTDTRSNHEAQREAYSACIRELQANMENGNLPPSEAKTVIVDTEEKIAEFTIDDAIMQANKHKMKGDLVDTYLRDINLDMAYVDAMVMRCRPPHNHKAWFKSEGGRDPKSQARFRRDVINRYDSRFNDLFWCPISRGWVSSHNITAAHLVQYNTGEANCDYLFGKAESTHGHLMCPSNSLMLHKDFELALDAGRIIIVPASEEDVDPQTNKKVDLDNDKEPYKVRVLDRNLIDPGVPGPWLGTVEPSKLDGRILEFRNDNRPKKRYLWFLAIINLARRHRCLVPGWQKDKEILGSAIWASPGEYLRRSVMHCIMRQIGFFDDPEAILKLGPTLTGGLEETPIDKEISDRVAVSLSPPRGSRGAQKGGEEDSPVNGIVQSRAYSDVFRQPKGPTTNRFADLHAMNEMYDNGDEERDEEGDEDSGEENDGEGDDALADLSIDDSDDERDDSPSPSFRPTPHTSH